jgi:hypothetical protein
MLLSTILSILGQNQIAQAEPKIAEKTDKKALYGPYKIYADAAMKLAPDIKDLPTKQSAEAGPLRPMLLTHGPPATSVHELIKAVAKFEKNAPKRVLDVFH